MRFSMIIFFADTICRFWLLEVAQRGASNTFVSDCNIPNENKHPKRFKSMENAEKSYSEVNSSKISIISLCVFLLTFSLHVTSHRHISLLTGKSTSLSGQWRISLGVEPKAMMTDKEADALISLKAARDELVLIKNALHGTTQEQRKKFFRNEQFMKQWMEGVNSLIRRLVDIEGMFKR